MSVYDQKPDRFLADLGGTPTPLHTNVYCAGFELGVWRGEGFAFHLAEWLPEFALPEDELRVNHGNLLLKLNQAAIRVYTSSKYASRGEAGEIALHAVCREFFNTTPISPRVFYKSSSNDVIKAFDMVHVRFPNPSELEIWLGESKLYEDGKQAIADAIKSVTEHLDAGFLTNQKLLLGPQIPKSTPRYAEIAALFKSGTSLDQLVSSAVFAIAVASTSPSAAMAKLSDAAYVSAVNAELADLAERLEKSGLAGKVRVLLIYLPLASKKGLVDAFDKRLKGLQ